MGNRMSSLPIAQFCARGPALSQIAAGRAAAQSTAFHALCADDPKASDLLALLTDEEREELVDWKRPTTCILDPDKGVILEYSAAVKEVTVALDTEGMCVDENDPAAITVGHLDFVWILEVDGRRCAYVGDLKRTQWTATDGPQSLQLLAYLFAVCAKFGCDVGVCGIWHLTEGSWHWGEAIDMLSTEAATLWERVRAAALNTTGSYSTGPHCSGCYGRLSCPAHLFPPEMASTSLAPFVAGGEMTPERVSRVVLEIKRAKDTIEKAEAMAREYVLRGGQVVDPESGSIWKPIEMPGRVSFDSKALEREHPELAQRYAKQGKPYHQFRWTKGAA